MSKKIPSALLLNDIHVSKDNIPEFQKNWDEALYICDQYGIEDMIIGGDLWLSRSSQTLSTLMAVRQAIIKATKAGISITVAEGNHCKVDQESVLGYSHLFSEYPHVYVVDDYSIINISNDVELYIMSYFPENGSFVERLKKMVKAELNASVHNILYIHEGINGALSTPNEKELPTNIFSDFDTVLVGHYHNRCIIKGTNIEYIGSSRQHNFGEDEEKGYTIIYDDNSKLIDKLDDMKADGRYKIKTRISCTSQEAPNIDKQKLLEAGSSKVEIVTEDVEITETTAHSLDKKFDKSGIKQEYTSFCANKGIINIEMGLQYLDKIS